jgi:pimeloyl-ACP methyl ester carboxylesterase
MNTQPVRYKTVKIEGYNVFYREAGPKDAPAVLLLHGYPTSSHMYRQLIPRLSEKYHVIAPDLIGFGFSDAPDHSTFNYTFDNLTKYVQGLINHLGLKRFAIQVFDYGAPVGYRLAVANPEKITGIISQNGNAYEEGLSDGWAILKKYWDDPSEANRNALRSPDNAAAIQWQYFTGTPNRSLVAPESYTLDQVFMDRKDNAEIQLDLFRDYATNVALYPAFQEYFRKNQPPLLAVWGDKDPYFIPPGAEAFKRDLPNATVKFYDAGHFALETHLHEIGQEILCFLEKLEH